MPFGHHLDDLRSKESSLTTWLCSTTSRSSWLVRVGSDDRDGNMFSSCPCETLQTRGYFSCTYISSSGVGEKDGCDSCDASDVELIILINFFCNSFSQHSFCATNLQELLYVVFVGPQAFLQILPQAIAFVLLVAKVMLLLQECIMAHE